jgi:ABC-type nickel/cobalt efflux system permease component RcnA
MMRFLLAVICLAACSGFAQAHPVAKNTHDRTVVVRLLKSAQPGHLVLRADYRLEADEWTIIEKDLEPYRADLDLFTYRNRPLDFYREFARLFAPALADRLVAKVDGKRVDFAGVSAAPRLHDEQGQALGHLRCDFGFEAHVPLSPASQHELVFREHSYLGEEGRVDLSLAPSTDFVIRSKTEPDDALKKRPELERQPGDEEKLREVKAVFVAALAPVAVAPIVTAPTPVPTQDSEPRDDDHSLLRLFLYTDYGFLLTMLLATLFGAAHALTPGHGKTLVAAYLVAERGTVWHAIVLGLVTTLTHTGAVLLLAGLLYFLPAAERSNVQEWIQQGLGLVMGLLVTSMGFWLLLQRLAGRADHIHLGGGHHHHGAPVSNAEREPASWWRVIVLGMVGGMIPCGDAVLLLLYTTGRGELWLVLPALLAFSAGLAAVLVLIGVLVVQVPRFAESRWGRGRITRLLPILSAVIVTLMGLWLCYEGTHGR